MNKPASFRFRFSQDKSVPAEGLDVECIIAPLSAMKSSVSQLGLSGSRWASEDAIKQYAKRLKDSESDDSGTRTFQVAFSSGSTTNFLFFDPAAKTFELHSEMQKAFSSCITAVDSRMILDLRLLDQPNQVRVLHAFVFLATTAGWEPTSYGLRTRKEKSRKERAKEIVVCSGLVESEAKALVKRSVLLGEANNEVRTLADLPSNELNPKSYREVAREFARQWKLDFEFWDRKELARRKAGAFLAVTRSDPETSAGIVHLSYAPAGKQKSRKSLVLVGKGICFDTGGYNVKPGHSMLGMHGDMTGSALAMALCGYFARMEVDFEVHAYMALAENLISPTAYKPNEVVIASDGTAIEVVDTDAEGRMVLSDTLAFARKTRPDLLVDFATLTGAAIRSLDTRKSAVFSNREDLALLAVRAGDTSGERVWSFPLDEDYRRNMKSKIADILQCSESNNADHIYAATFLAHFAGKETPWVHMDLAACENKGGLGLISTNTTGFGVLWTDAFVREALT